MAVAIERRVFTVAEYERMAEVGILGEDDRIELIDGEIITMSPIGAPHAACVNRLSTNFTLTLQRRAIVSTQNPIRLGEYSEPQPDIVILHPRRDFYSHSHPIPADILLVIEVAETSLEYDRDVKMPLYARSSIPELWLIDLQNDIVWQFSALREGKYTDLKRLTRGQSITATPVPELTLNIESILG